MRGFPKHLNTKSDYDNIVRMFPHDPKTEKAFKGLLDTKDYWELTPHKVEKAQEDSIKALVDPCDTLEIREVENEGVKEKYLAEKVQDESCKLFKLGFKIDEVATLAKVDLKTVTLKDEKAITDAKIAKAEVITEIAKTVAIKPVEDEPIKEEGLVTEFDGK